MTLFEIQRCEEEIDILRKAIAKGGLDQRGYDAKCGELRGIEWVIKELHLKPNQKQPLTIKQEFAA